MRAMPLAGHYWTIAPLVSHVVRRTTAPLAARWSTLVGQESFGEIHVRGLLRQSANLAPLRRSLLIVIHGLGGHSSSHYVIPAARAAHELDLPCLRLDLRGAGTAPKTDDFYHGGLWQDVARVVSSESLADYTDIYLLGYSLGGHVALRYATEDVDPRVRAVAAIGSPLDLGLSAAAIDRPACWVYRQHVLVALKKMVAPILRRRPGSLRLTMSELLRFSTLREWDDRVIAPRHGFAGADDYYAKASVGPRLPELKRPALLVASEGDPMVIPSAVRPALARAPALLDVRWTPLGGHVGFPPSFDLGERAPFGIERQAIRWLLRNGKSE